MQPGTSGVSSWWPPISTTRHSGWPVPLALHPPAAPRSLPGQLCAGTEPWSGRQRGRPTACGSSLAGGGLLLPAAVLCGPPAPCPLPAASLPVPPCLVEGWSLMSMRMETCWWIMQGLPPCSRRACGCSDRSARRQPTLRRRTTTKWQTWQQRSSTGAFVLVAELSKLGEVLPCTLIQPPAGLQAPA